MGRSRLFVYIKKIIKIDEPYIYRRWSFIQLRYVIGFILFYFILVFIMRGYIIIILYIRYVLSYANVII